MRRKRSSPRNVTDVESNKDDESKKSKKEEPRVVESNKDKVAPIVISGFPQGKREQVTRIRCYDVNLTTFDDVSDDGGGGGGGVLPLTLVEGVAVGPQEPGYEAVIRRTWGRTKQLFNVRSLSRFLYEAGGRGTPMESMFLNSTEIHVLCRAAPPGDNYSFVGHYTRFNHNLEIRTSFEGHVVPESMFLVGISSAFNHCKLPKSIDGPAHRSLNNPKVHFSFPVCEDEGNKVRNLEVGHAIASLTYAAAELGWEVRLLDASFGFEELKLLTGLTREIDLANDVPVAALVVFTSQSIHAKGAAKFATSSVRSEIKRRLGQGIEWKGHPHRARQVGQVSESLQRHLASLQETADGGDKKHMLFRHMSPGLTVQDVRYPSEATLWRAMRSRSSGVAVDFDENYYISATNFENFLFRCCRIDVANVGGGACFPHGVLPWFPRVNLLFFVNRVACFRPGLYCLVRSPIDIMSLKDSIKSSAYQWTPVTWPDFFSSSHDFSTVGMSFHMLEIDKSHEGAPIHQQQLLKASLFLVAMIAPKSKDLTKDLMQRYWEAGFLGELLIVEAQAQGISATIVPQEPYSFWHQVLHRGDGQILSLYAVGKPKDPVKTSDDSYDYDFLDVLRLFESIN